MHNHNLFWWRFFPRRELSKVYLSIGLRSFAISLIAIFIPLFLYREKGFTLEQTLWFFLFYSIVFAISTPLAAKFSSRYGIRHSILAGVPLYLLFMALLHFLPKGALLLLAASSSLGVSQAFYWMGMHLVFHHASHRSHRGEEVGKRSSVIVLSSLAAPFLGGALITLAGFPAVFAAAAVVLFSSALVLLRDGDGHTPYHFSLRSVLDRKHWKNSLFFISRGTHVIAEGVVWPLFIFLILGSYFSLGIAGTLMSLSSAFLFWKVGKFSDHGNKRKIMRIFTVAESLIWVLMALVKTAMQVFGITILFSLVRASREAPMGAMEYDKAKGEAAAYFVSREVFICLGRIVLLSLVILLSNLQAGLFIQAAANFAAFLF